MNHHTSYENSILHLSTKKPIHVDRLKVFWGMVDRNGECLNSVFKELSQWEELLKQVELDVLEEAHLEEVEASENNSCEHNFCENNSPKFGGLEI